MIRSVIILSLFIFAGSSLIVTVDAHDGATGIVKQRMDRFSESKQQLNRFKRLLARRILKRLPQQQRLFGIGRVLRQTISQKAVAKRQAKRRHASGSHLTALLMRQKRMKLRLMRSF